MDKEKTKEISSVISWRAPEFEYHHKDASWYWLSIIAAIILVALALWQKNFLFVIFVVIAEMVVISLVGRFPPIWEFKISEKGVEIGRPNKKEKKFYPYRELESFDIHPAGEEYKELVLKSQSRLKPFFKINIHSKDEEKIKKFFLKFLPQKEIHSSAVDSVSKLIRF
ncbi:MAG: AzlD domain-containing protein [Candidatus Paceibacterota bacterium]